MALAWFIKAVTTFASGPDTMSFGYWLQCAAPYTSNADLITTLNAWDSAMTSDESPSAYADMAKMIRADQSVSKIALYYYADPTANATYVAEKSKSIAGTGPATEMNQKALCVTLNTGYSGARNRGRCYLPACGLYGTTGGLVASGDQNNAALACSNNMASLLEHVRSGDGGDGSRVVVLSLKGDFANPVTGLSIDSRYDIQRRRADKQVGVRTTYTGPNPSS